MISFNDDEVVPKGDRPGDGLIEHMRSTTSSNVSERHAGGMPPSEHADWIIDLGPEGGVNGGEIVAQGTPEDVAASARSFTGAYLKETLKKVPHSPSPLAGEGRGEGGRKARTKSRRKAASAEADQPDLIVAK